MTVPVRPRLFIDESVYGPTVSLLRLRGWDLERASDVCPAAADPEVARAAYVRQRIIVTEDFDFGDLIVRLQLPALGLVIISLADLRGTAKPLIVEAALEGHTNAFFGNLLVIEPARVRVRLLSPPP